MELTEVVCEITEICNRNDSCARCPLREYVDICDKLYADGLDELSRFSKLERKLRKEFKRAQYMTNLEEERKLDAGRKADPGEDHDASEEV